MGCCQSREQSQDIHLQESRHISIPTGSNRPLKAFHKYVKQETEFTLIYNKRLAFWDTQPSYSGRVEVWQILRLVCEAETLETAQALFDTADLTCPTGKLTDGCYDHLGNHYSIPAYCIGPLPAQTAKMEEVTTIPSVDPEEEITIGPDFPVTVRLSSGGDIVLNINRGMKIFKLKRLILPSVAGLESSKLRIVYLGKILQDNQQIEDTKIAENSVVQAMFSL